MEALDIEEKCFEPGSEPLARVLADYARRLDAVGATDQAAALRARAQAITVARAG